MFQYTIGAILAGAILIVPAIALHHWLGEQDQS